MSIGVPLGLEIAKLSNWRFAMLVIIVISFIVLINISILIPMFKIQAPQQHILLKKHPEHGNSAVALNSSINYLGSAIGSAIGGIILFTVNSINVLIYSALGITIIGILLQLLNLSIDKD
nr:hypothetical protein KUHPSE03_p1500 [Staphylococcus epidermidis]